jgi:hypothetical protein
LPDDDYDHIRDDELTWDFMYKHVFRYYYLIFPAMSKIIPFNNRTVMEREAPDIVGRTDPALWHTTRYMPITRDLSKVKRALIDRWAGNLPGGGPGPARPYRPRIPDRP